MTYAEARDRLRNHSNLSDAPGSPEESFLAALDKADREDRWPEDKSLSDDDLRCLATASAGHKLLGAFDRALGKLEDAIQLREQ